MHILQCGKWHPINISHYHTGSANDLASLPELSQVEYLCLMCQMFCLLENRRNYPGIAASTEEIIWELLLPKLDFLPSIFLVIGTVTSGRTGMEHHIFLCQCMLGGSANLRCGAFPDLNTIL